MGNIGPQGRLYSVEGMRWAARAKIVKGIDNIQILQAAPSDALLIHRHVLDGANLSNPLGIHQAIMDSLQGFRRPGRLVVETVNETPKEGTAALIGFLLTVVPMFHRDGIYVAGPSWASGDYDPPQVEAMRQYGWCGLDFLALHAYWGTLGFTPWNALHWRAWYDVAKDPDTVLITECGRDMVRDGPNGTYVGKGGYVLDGLSPHDYAKELAAYSAQLRPNEHATPYVCGPTPDFAHYDLDPVVDDLLPLVGPQLTIPHPHPPPPIIAKGVSVTEKDRVYSNLWSRFGAVYNPADGITAKWIELTDAGRYLGAPLGPTQDTEDKTHRFQFFAAGVLSCKIGEWIVTEGMPPFRAG